MAGAVDLGDAPLGRLFRGRQIANVVFRVRQTPRPILRVHCSV